MKKNFLILASLFGFLTACSPLASATQNPIPTPYPPDYLPTVIALTANAANAVVTQTAFASLPVELPTDTSEPTITPTAFPTSTPTAIPGHHLGAIQFLAPGPMSKLVSPIQLHMMVITGADAKVQVDLYGEDGRLLARELRKSIETTEGAFMSVKITFETHAAAELGKITVTTIDSSGKIAALNSIRVLLLSEGVNTITPAGNLSEPVRVYQPLADEAVFGGVVNVKGDIWPLNLQSLVLELVDAEGKSIGLRVLNLNDINPQSFVTTIPYKVTETTSARLVIRQDDDRLPGVFYVYTQGVTLNP